MEKLQLLNSAGAFYPSILLAVLPIVFMLGGLWFIFKFFKKVETQSEWIKESEIFADKKFADYLNEKNLEGGSVFDVQEKKEFKANEIVEKSSFYLLKRKFTLSPNLNDLFKFFFKILGYDQNPDIVQKPSGKSFA